MGNLNIYLIAHDVTSQNIPLDACDFTVPLLPSPLYKRIYMT